MWIVQGEDVVVPKKAADELGERAGRRKPDWVIKDTVCSRGGHGFDAEAAAEEWAKEGMHFFTRYWLA